MYGVTAIALNVQQLHKVTHMLDATVVFHTEGEKTLRTSQYSALAKTGYSSPHCPVDTPTLHILYDFYSLPLLYLGTCLKGLV